MDNFTIAELLLPWPRPFLVQFLKARNQLARLYRMRGFRSGSRDCRKRMHAQGSAMEVLGSQDMAGHGRPLCGAPREKP